jgi:hypothetical protein
MSDYVDHEYVVIITLPANAPAPDPETIARAVYQATDADTQDAVTVDHA